MFRSQTQVMVNEDEMMELIDQVRFNLPDEIKQANWTVSEQQRIISEAHAEAARIMSRANERAEETASEHEILRRAERHSGPGDQGCAGEVDQIIREAEGYAMEQLKQLEAISPDDGDRAPRSRSAHRPTSRRPRKAPTRATGS